MRKHKYATEYLGLDVEPVRNLAAITASWQVSVDAALVDLHAAEQVLGVSVGVSGLIEQIGHDGRAMGAAMRRALDEVESFQVADPSATWSTATFDREITTPRSALLLAVPVGASVNRHLAALAIASGETYRQTAIRSEVRVHANRNPQHRTRIDHLLAEYETIDPGHHGDLGGTHEVEIRNRYEPTDGSADFATGLGVVTHALTATGDRSQMRLDEFGVILHDNDKITVVLGGVIDLTNPRLGYDPRHDSVRDLDQEALASLFSADLDDNQYGRLVRDWFVIQQEAGVIEAGAEVLIVGYSFGADTALDLASDPSFTGLVNLTHVVAAGHFSQPQLSHVNGTEVGVLQNASDLAIIVERVAHAGSTPGALLTGGIGYLAAALTRVAPLGEIGFVSQFNGGVGTDIGHHPDRYIDYLESNDLDHRIVNFLSDIGRSGYGGPGTSIAVDVSVPPAASRAYNGPPPVRAPGPIPSSAIPASPLPTPAPTPRGPQPVATPTPSRTPTPRSSTAPHD